MTDHSQPPVEFAVVRGDGTGGGSWDDGRRFAHGLSSGQAAGTQPTSLGKLLHWVQPWPL